MSPPDDDWGAPSFFGRSALAEPSLNTQSDPIAGAFIPSEWGADTRHAPQWSETTYIGRRRYRPDKQLPEPIEPPDVPDAESSLNPLAGPAAIAAAQEDGSDRRLLTSSRTMAIGSLVSRITGFLRSSLLVAALGIGLHGVGDAYNAANNFPNMLYELLLGGVLSSVLIPLLVHAEEHDEDKGLAYTQRLLSLATVALGVMTLVAVALAPLIAAGFVENPAQRHLTSIFATLLLPEIFFYGIGAMYMAVLNLRNVFGPGAWAPVVNNVIMIITICVFWMLPGPTTLTPSSMTNAQILVLGIGTTLGIAAQALVLLPALMHSGFKWQWRFRARPQEVGRMRQVGSLAGWVLAYVVVSQIGVTVIAKVGLDVGAFTVFTNADLLFQMPYGILVVSLLTALMPRLSRSAARGDTPAVVSDMSLGSRLSAVALVPITAGLIVLGPVLGVVLFAYGETSVAGGRLIGTSLALSAFGLFPFALVMLQLRVFYAMRDGRTPTLINVYIVAVKVALVLICKAVIKNPSLEAESLNFSTSASYVVGAVVGHYTLTRRLGPLGFGAVARTTTRVAVVSALGAVAALVVVLGGEHLLGRGHTGAIASLIVGGLVWLGVTGLLIWRLRLPEITTLRGNPNEPRIVSPKH